MPKLILIVASMSGLMAVVLGAFGAHGLKGKVSAELLSAFQTAVQYQMFHSLALLALAVLIISMSVSSKPLIIAAYCWIFGMILFCGSLYGLVLGGPNWLGPVTPLGGLLLIGGWFSLFLAALKL